MIVMVAFVSENTTNVRTGSPPYGARTKASMPSSSSSESFVLRAPSPTSCRSTTVTLSREELAECILRSIPSAEFRVEDLDGNCVFECGAYGGSSCFRTRPGCRRNDEEEEEKSQGTAENGNDANARDVVPRIDLAFPLLSNVGQTIGMCNFKLRTTTEQDTAAPQRSPRLDAETDAQSTSNTHPAKGETATTPTAEPIALMSASKSARQTKRPSGDQSTAAAATPCGRSQEYVAVAAESLTPVAGTAADDGAGLGLCDEHNSCSNRSVASSTTTESNPQAAGAASLFTFQESEILGKMQTGAALHETIVDDDGKPIDYVFLEVNPAFEELTGLKAADIIGRRATEVLPGIEKDPADWIGTFGRVAVSGATTKFEAYSQPLGKWFSGVAYRPVGLDADELQFVSICSDATEHVHMQEALRESEERHRNLFESMMQGVVYQDFDGSIIAANPSAERILGLTVDQMMGRTSVDPSWRAIREDGSDYPGETHPSMLALATGEPVTNAVMGIFHPHTEDHHWIIVDAIPRFLSKDDDAKTPDNPTNGDHRNGGENSEKKRRKPDQVFTTFTDITETKRFERELVRAKEQAIESDKLKSAFLANMSHEIRTPLNGIIGHIDLALSNHLDQQHIVENLEGLQVARQSGELLISIIEDILDLSKIEAGQLIVQRDEVFSLSKVLDQTLSLGQTVKKQRKKTIELEKCVGSDIRMEGIMGDPFRLLQVLNNLVSNAIKFTDQGKVELRVRLLPDSRTLEFGVCDTGKGIAKKHLESIFEPFRQVEIGDTRKHGGTGLGLTISRKLVELMGGSLRVESNVDGPHKGSSFYFTLPYRFTEVEPNSDDGLNSSAQMPKLRSGDSSHSLNPQKLDFDQDSGAFKKKILVAEDDPVSRRLVVRMLERAGYSQILLAEDGEIAVTMFESHPDIALCLMDAQMPNMGGLEATKIIREREAQWLSEGGTSDAKRRNVPVPIIALSAGAMKGDKENGIAAGMNDYLTKPVNYKLLLETLTQYLS